MAHFTGTALYMAFASTAINTDYRTVSWDDSIDTVDTTAGADTDRTYLATLRDVTISMSLIDNGTAGSAVKAALVTGSYGTIEIAPLGTATGKPKYSCAAWVKSNSPSYPYDDVVAFDVELQRDGAWITNYEDLGSVY